MKRTKKKLSAWLPSTPCTPEMRDKIVTIAENEGRSLADVQRDAFSLFLSRFDSLTNVDDSIPGNMEPA